ncbi:MAG: hypothetical protein ABI353_05700 [Isosphaeraceae bacterium]
MTEDDLFEILDPVLSTLGAVVTGGDSYQQPLLDVLRYYTRPVRLSWMPVVGRALSVVAIVRQPVDVGLTDEGYRILLRRLSMAANDRFPPWKALSIGLTALVLSPEPIQPDDDTAVQKALGRRSRLRAVPLALFRVNLGQEAMAMALAQGPDGLFAEPEAVADALTTRFRRFVPLLPS